LQHCTAPESCEKIAVCEENVPWRFIDGVVQFDVFFDLVQFFGYGVRIFVAATEVFEGLLGVEWSALFEKPARSGDNIRFKILLMRQRKLTFLERRAIR
jgi:hypothetical protein